MALATLTHIGRAAIAKAISLRPLHLAWGTGDPAWDKLAATDGGLPRSASAAGTAFPASEGESRTGRAGEPNPAVAPDAVLPPLIESATLVNEIGRRTPQTIGFVRPDEAGDIVIPVSAGAEGAVQEARYRLVTDGSPTPFLYVQTHYNYADASNAVIREMGLFMDTEFADGLPEGQRYFIPADIKSPGLLLAAQIILPPINRSPSVRQTVEFVLPV